jgi:hypothetical protein
MLHHLCSFPTYRGPMSWSHVSYPGGSVTHCEYTSGLHSAADAIQMNQSHFSTNRLLRLSVLAMPFRGLYEPAGG